MIQSKPQRGISYSGYHLNIIQFKQKMTIVTLKEELQAMELTLNANILG